MKLSEKIFTLRKEKGLSQEELAEKLNVSRQAVSRWEGGSALPDATNVLQLSKLFEVSADYLLNDDYERPNGTAEERVQPKRDIKKVVACWLSGIGLGGRVSDLSGVPICKSACTFCSLGRWTKVVSLGRRVSYRL